MNTDQLRARMRHILIRLDEYILATEHESLRAKVGRVNRIDSAIDDYIVYYTCFARNTRVIVPNSAPSIPDGCPEASVSWGFSRQRLQAAGFRP